MASDASPPASRAGFPARPGRILPSTDGLSGDFYGRAAETGRLHLQRCDACRTWRHPPRYRCAACGSDAWSWAPSSGSGRIFSWTVTHRPIDPAFAADVPYAVVVVELEEGVRVVGNLLDLPPADLALDLHVTVALEVVSSHIALVHFRPA